MPDNAPAPRKKILLVDDSKTMLAMHRMILVSQFDLVVASDGQEGLDKAIAEAPAIILMDVSMPRMDGIEACRRIRADARTTATPIIMVTTRGEEESIQRAYENGCTDFVTKPIDPVELLTKIRNYLP
jgi:CheY-like chemotaxis protein